MICSRCRRIERPVVRGDLCGILLGCARRAVVACERRFIVWRVSKAAFGYEQFPAQGSFGFRLFWMMLLKSGMTGVQSSHASRRRDAKGPPRCCGVMMRGRSNSEVVGPSKDGLQGAICYQVSVIGPGCCRRTNRRFLGGSGRRVCRRNRLAGQTAFIAPSCNSGRRRTLCRHRSNRSIISTSTTTCHRGRAPGKGGGPAAKGILGLA